MRLWFRLRRLIARSWLLSRCYYPLRGARLLGSPNDQIWYFAYFIDRSIALRGAT
jgi:hypothetical protein